MIVAGTGRSSYPFWTLFLITTTKKKERERQTGRLFLFSLFLSLSPRSEEKRMNRWASSSLLLLLLFCFFIATIKLKFCDTKHCASCCYDLTSVSIEHSSHRCLELNNRFDRHLQPLVHHRWETTVERIGCFSFLFFFRDVKQWTASSVGRRLMNMTDREILPYLLLLMLLGKFPMEVKQSIFNFRVRLYSPLIIETMSCLLTVRRRDDQWRVLCLQALHWRQFSQFNCPLWDLEKHRRND